VSVGRLGFKVLAALVLICACRKESGVRAPLTVTGSYCDKGIKSQITVGKDVVAFVKPGKGGIMLKWSYAANGYYAQLPGGRAYKLEYRAPDFALHDCTTEKSCSFSRMIPKCD